MLKCLNVQMLRLLIVPLSETKRFSVSQSFQIKMMKQKRLRQKRDMIFEWVNWTYLSRAGRES